MSAENTALWKRCVKGKKEKVAYGKKHSLVSHAEVQEALLKEKKYQKLYKDKLLRGKQYHRAKSKMVTLRRAVKGRLLMEKAKLTPPEVVTEFRELLRADQPQPTEETK